MYTLGTDALLNPETGEQITQIQFMSTTPDRAKISTCAKLVVFSGSVMAVIAVAVVPYLVMNSVYYLSTHEKTFTFQEMMHSSNAVFWVFGPLTSILATLAIAPFNIYNTYKTIKAVMQQNKHCMTPCNVLKTVAGIIFLSSGSVNGYNTNAAYRAVISDSRKTVNHLFCGSVTAIATIFAGLSDARVVIVYFGEDLPRDYRYLKRGVQHSLQKMGCAKQSATSYQSLDRFALLEKLQKKLDDFRMISLLALTSREIQAHRSLILQTQWIYDTLSSEAFLTYKQLMNKPFPLQRYILSDVVGTGLSATLAYYGNMNVVNYAYLAIITFLEYCELPTDSRITHGFATTFSYIGYVIGMFLSFFLIRDVFFRDISKTIIRADFTLRNILTTLLPLFPAFSFGLLNVILTILNDELSSQDTILVSCAAIIGATVVSRYGIQGGLEEFRGKRDLRRELAGIPNLMMEHYKTLDGDQLLAIDEGLCSNRDEREN